MPAGKKKKKPAANPARGFATTSIASKPRIEPISEPSSTDNDCSKKNIASEPQGGSEDATSATQHGTNTTSRAQQLSPEEFERQLEESELQSIVDKHSQKAKRDASRQVTRLKTDRRLLRGQADILNTRKWLPPDVMDEILDAITAESRSNGSAFEVTTIPKPLSEEDLIVRLWVLQQTLGGAGFSKERTTEALTYILTLSEKISVVNKESIWGLDESLEWLARECPRDDLPDYDNIQRKKVLTGKLPQVFEPSMSTMFQL